MTRKLVDGVWIVTCDWEDPTTGEKCTLGRDDFGNPNGEPRMVVDPDAGREADKHYQCGAHHGIVKQEHLPEFQVPEGEDRVENEDVIKKN